MGMFMWFLGVIGKNMSFPTIIEIKIEAELRKDISQKLMKQYPIRGTTKSVEEF
ncbi:MAG: hypothetical protein Ta2B_11750 [Termitinemataceae bacterium]|nr:MAG: hypothetical protein Ta2B_11750 [Termitinemataceae bacterium]